jgi:hypothetical protein
MVGDFRISMLETAALLFGSQTLLSTHPPTHILAQHKSRMTALVLVCRI